MATAYIGDGALITPSGTEWLETDDGLVTKKVTTNSVAVLAGSVAGTAAGRAMLNAADVPAQQVLLALAAIALSGSASDLITGTIPDARFPATLPAISGVNLTALNASNLGSGTVPDARFPATLPAVSGVNLTALNASNLGSGTVPDARFPATLPAISGVNLTNLNASNLASGTVADARLSANIPLLNALNVFTVMQTINSTGGSVTPGPASTMLFVIGGNGNAGITRILADTYMGTGGGYAVFSGRAARGTATAPTALQNNDEITHLSGTGYGATAYSTASRGFLSIFAAENWTDTSQGTRIAIVTTAPGGTSTTEKVRFWGDGGLQIGGTFTASLGAGALSMAGQFSSSFNGALSTPGITGTGTWITGGSATTTKPYFLLETTGATSTAWSTSGTGFGINSASGFVGNLIDAQINSTSRFRIDSSGNGVFGGSITTVSSVTASGILSTSFTATASNPGIKATGAWFAGGTATTTKPMLLIEASGATSTGWNANGTGIGTNAASGFTGLLIDAQLNGVTKFNVDSTGTITMTNAIAGVTNISSTGRISTSYSNAASLCALTLTGTAFTGGTATTTKPLVMIEPTGTTSTGWSTNGTYLGVNSVTGFTGNLIDLQNNGNARFSVNGAGNMTVASTATFNGSILGAGRITTSVTSTSSLSAIAATGNWFTGGSSTTTKPQVLIEGTGATTNAWNTAGTGFGVNSISSFTGNLLDIQVNGSSMLSISAAGLSTYADGSVNAYGTSTGHKFGNSVSQKMGWWNTAPVVQPAGATQVAPAAYATGVFGLDSDAHMQALYDLVVAMRTALVNTGIMKGAA